MRLLCAVGLTAICGLQVAHGQPPQPPNPATQHAPDGGTSVRIQSIDVPPLTSAPFTARVDTAWTMLLADGTSATVKNHRTIARDSAGRIFQERRSFAPNGDTQETRITALEYSDPLQHTFIQCNPQRRTCYETDYSRPQMSSMPAGMTGLRVCGCASRPGEGIRIEQKALGEQNVEGVRAIGSQEVTTLPAGLFGNKTAQPIVKEFWYSPQLGINLVTKRFDPRSGSENFTVGEVSLTEPDIKLFTPPASYAIVRQMVVRPAAAPAQ